MLVSFTMQMKLLEEKNRAYRLSHRCLPRYAKLAKPLRVAYDSNSFTILITIVLTMGMAQAMG